MSAYKLTPSGSVTRLSDGASIPPDSANVDYAAFLAWVGAGGVPDPVGPPSADEINAPIYVQLDALDRKSIRALREGDAARVAQIEAQATALRATLVK